MAMGSLKLCLWVMLISVLVGCSKASKEVIETCQNFLQKHLA